MVIATAGAIIVMTSTPRKLNTAAIKMACRGFMARVETAVAMALGASVAPFTMITPILSRVTTRRMGFCISSERKKVHSIVTEFLPTDKLHPENAQWPKSTL